jgi:hypothetical protein
VSEGEGRQGTERRKGVRGREDKGEKGREREKKGTI